MEIIIFQLLSCLYFNNSGIEVPVCIRKPIRSTDYQRERSYTVSSVNRLPAGAFIYRAVGQPSTSRSVHIPCRLSTDSWQRREVCAKSVDRLPASKGLRLNMEITPNYSSTTLTLSLMKLGPKIFTKISTPTLRNGDTSDYPSNHPSGIKTGLNSKVLGMFKDEAGGKQIVESVGLRAKLYS